MALKAVPQITSSYANNAKEAGFTLLETLIAFIILSFSIGAALQVLSLNRQKIARAEEYSSVVRLVDEIKMQVFLSDNPQRSISGFSITGLNWRVEPISISSDNKVRIFSIAVSNKNTPTSTYRFFHSSNIKNTQ